VILGLIAGAIGFNVFQNLKEAQIKTRGSTSRQSRRAWICTTSNRATGRIR